ncbi:hypothetical protein ACE01N_14035 [Saccharicrinis sp. FJH2]|uniref:hypothetical protein n=1 Tax=Saccharicrinis sp. FJH65 TaxID=3344659 RepID=UPI0035F4DB4B
MLQKIIIITLLTAYISPVSSQNLQIDYGIDYQSYEMSNLKELTNTIFKTVPFDAQITSNFPPYARHQISGLYSINNNLKLGFSFTYLTTGSRISRADYSGSYNFDMIINGYSPGIKGQVKISDFKLVSMYFYNSIGLTFSILKLNESLNIVEYEPHTSIDNFISTNMFFEPGLRLEHNISDFCFSLNSGYNFSILKGDLKYKKDKRYILTDEHEESLQANWSGFYIGLAVGIILH